MAKNSVGDWDTDPDLNTDIGGTDIDEGCAPSGINDAIRKVMAQIGTWYASVNTSLASFVKKDGSVAWTGNMPAGGFKITGLADGTSDQDAATKAQADMAGPVGSVVDFAGNSPPTGWLFCYGQAVSRTTYAALYAVVGNTYGAGDGSTTFNIPDLRGRVTAGQDDMGGVSANRLTGQSGGVNGDTLGAAGGAETHTLTEAEMPSHDHASGSLATGNAGNHNHTVDRGGTGGSDLSAATATSITGSLSTSSAGAHTHTITGSTANAGSDDAHNNVQPTMIMNKIIRAVA